MSLTKEFPIVFIGTYTHTDSQGIYTCRFDSDSGALEQVSIATGAGNPSFLALHPSKRFLYAASEVHEFDGKEQGAVYAYSVDGEIWRTDLHQQPGHGRARTVSRQSGRNRPLPTRGQLSRRQRLCHSH